MSITIERAFLRICEEQRARQHPTTTPRPAPKPTWRTQAGGS